MNNIQRFNGLLVFVAAIAMSALAVADDISDVLKTNVETERVFGREHPGPYKHPASITQLDNGDLYVAYYGGAGTAATPPSTAAAVFVDTAAGRHPR